MSPTTRHLVLLGLMGAGKSTVAVAVAGRTGWSITDSDVAIRAETGLTARELRARRGIEALHRLEHEHLLRSLAAPAPTIICAAASVVEDPACRAALCCAAALSVWLDVDPARLVARFDMGGHRPAYGADVREFLAAQRRRRELGFREVADLRIDPQARTPAEIAAEILEVAGAPGSMMS